MAARVRFAWIVLVAASFAVAGCNGGSAVQAPNPGAPVESSSPNVCAGVTAPPHPVLAPPSTSSQKAPIQGLVDLGQASAVNMTLPPPNTLYYVCQVRPAMSGLVVNETWSDLQPRGSDQRPITRNIDKALALVALYNRSASQPLAVRLRIWAGINAPSWAKNLGGPIQICDTPGTSATPTPSSAAQSPKATPTPCAASALRTVGAFWSSPYETAWQNLQRQLAAKYDRRPLIREVSLASCTSLTDEPFIVPEDSFSQLHLRAAGYNDAAFENCLANALNDYAGWQQTLVDYIFNPFRRTDVRPPKTDLAFTKSVMVSCRAAIGSRCVLGNETMGKFTPPPSPGPSATPSVAYDYFVMWKYMRSRGPNIFYQTASSANLRIAGGGNNVAGWNQAVHFAHRFGATSLELWPSEDAASPCVTKNGWINGYACFGTRKVLYWKGVIAP
jgi:hypothetical protein